MFVKGIVKTFQSKLLRQKEKLHLPRSIETISPSRPYRSRDDPIWPPSRSDGGASLTTTQHLCLLLFRWSARTTWNRDAEDQVSHGPAGERGRSPEKELLPAVGGGGSAGRPASSDSYANRS